jgi:hypothetical protein
MRHLSRLHRARRSDRISGACLADRAYSRTNTIVAERDGMTGELLLLLLGAVLILAGVLGGSVPVRVAGLGHMGRTPRFAAAGAGLLCVVAALILIEGDDYVAPAGPITFTIANELGPNQVFEEIRVFLKGRDVGVVRVDERSPTASLTVTVPKAGRYAYRTESKSQVKGQKPSTDTHDDNVFIDGKSQLVVYYDQEGHTYLGPPR